MSACWLHRAPTCVCDMLYYLSSAGSVMSFGGRQDMMLIGTFEGMTDEKYVQGPLTTQPSVCEVSTAEDEANDKVRYGRVFRRWDKVLQQFGDWMLTNVNNRAEAAVLSAMSGDLELNVEQTGQPETFTFGSIRAVKTRSTNSTAHQDLSDQS